MNLTLGNGIRDMVMRGLLRRSRTAGCRRIRFSALLARRPAGLCAVLLVPPLMLGCATGLAPVSADLPVPATWQYGSPDRATDAKSDTVTRDWWRRFGSPELDSMVEQAREDSFDIAAASARVRQARATAQIADATRLPTVSGFADISRQGGLLVGTDASSGTSLDLGASTSYELDFWGGQRATRDAAAARAQAAIFDRDTVALTLSADAANAWLQTMSLRERTSLAAQNLATAQQILTFVAARVRGGSQTSLDLTLQRGLVASLKRTAAALQQETNDSAATLATLLGRTPSQLHLHWTSLDTLRVPSIDAGMPAALLTHRPDLAGAEAQLRAAHADVTVARAAMLPNITLTASTGVGSDRFRTLLSSPLYSVASGLTAPIFNGGALSAARNVALARQEELLNTYRQAIVAAFGDVERSLNALAGINAQTVAQEDALAQAQKGLSLAESRYRTGGELQITVLTAQQTLYAAKDETAQLNLARLQAAVTLYRVLGGGWESR